MENRSYKYFDLILGLFVAILLISNLVSVKAVKIPLPFLHTAFTFDGGTLLFPFSYIFADILTEVYGYERSRRVIWSGFAGLVLMAVVVWLVGVIPADPLWPQQKAYEAVLMTAPRIALGSIIAYFVGEFANSYILSRLKVKLRGKHLWMRTIGSTLVGELLDTVIFVYVAFWGVWEQGLIFSVLVSNYIFKTGYEIMATPFTYLVTGWLKKAEHEDHYDYEADYNPFLLK
ncbi:MAG TPA: queuosine precursor transporter [Bacillota bacterium]|nr:queuosine precursor transporter [Bacillota bacterium]